MSSAIVITASYDKQVRFWDAASGRTVRCFVFQDSQINALLLIHDTQALVVAGFGVLRVYDVSSILAAGGSAPAAVAPQPGAQGQAPPLLSSFESQGSMNFTSLGFFPLRHPAASPLRQSHSGGSIGSDGDESAAGTDTSSNAAHDTFGRTVSMLMPTMILAGPHPEVGVILYATSEDGHIRLFDAKSPVALRLLKDIYTGAAITCSCLSPDRRLLLTGSQIGVVSVWHVPSIVASASLEAGAQPPEGLTGEQRTEYEAMWRDAQLFGSKPLQEIPFEGDYTAIRSIAMDPLARWAVVATNGGSAHFLRFSHDEHLLGSKSAAATVVGSGSAGAGGGGGGGGGGGVPPRMPFGLLREGDGDVRDGPGLARRAGGVGEETNSLSHGGGGAQAGSESPSSAAHAPREGVYRSALVVNELSNLARRGSQSSLGPLPDARRGGGGGGGGGGGPRSSTHSARGTSGDGAGSGGGAALLDSLEHQGVGEGSPGSTAAAGGGQGQHTPHLSASTPAAHAALPPPTPRSGLQAEMEMESFYSFQAHYKYVLKVAISPDGEQLVTCSADYTIGRFVIPQVLRERGGGASAAAALPSRRSTTVPSTAEAEKPTENSRAVMGASASSAPHDEGCTASPSFAGGTTTTMTTAAEAGEEEGAEKGDGQLTGKETEVPDLVDTALGPLSSHETSAPSLEQATTARAAGALGGNRTAGEGGTPAPPAAVGALSGARLPQHYLFKPLKPLTGHNRWVWDCVFSDCCRFLFSCGSDAQVRMWNGLTSDRPQSTGFVGHTKPVVAILLCYSRGK